MGKARDKDRKAVPACWSCCHLRGPRTACGYSLDTGSSGFGPQRLGGALLKMASLTPAVPQQVVKSQRQPSHPSWPLVTHGQLRVAGALTVPTLSALQFIARKDGNAAVYTYGISVAHTL